jgi:hypothetical protein
VVCWTAASGASSAARQAECAAWKRQGEGALRHRLGAGLVKNLLGDDASLAHPFEHRVAGMTRRLRVAVGAQPLGQARQRHQQRRLARRQMPRLLAEIGKARRPYPFEIAAERRQRQVEAEDAVLAEAPFQRQRLCRFDEFGDDRARPPFEQPHRLHRQCRCAGHDMALGDQLAERPQRRERIDSGMRRKTLILGRDHICKWSGSSCRE